MPVPHSGVNAHRLARVLTAHGPEGPVRALFQPIDPDSGHAEVASIPAGELAFAGGTSRDNGSGSSPGFTVSMGWLWVTGKRPTCKTRLVIGGSDGTTFFARSTESLDQFYFIGPPSSRVHLRVNVPGQTRPVVVIDAANRYAQCAGGVLITRALVQSVPADAEFLATVNVAQLAAEAAGLAE